MKKLLGLVFVVVFLFTLASCSDNGSTNYSKEVYEAAYDEVYNGEAKYTTELTIKLEYDG